MRQIAPWPDYAGNLVQEGDRMVHPSGDTGIVVLLPGSSGDLTRWRVNYGGSLRSLAEEIGAAGRCVVIDETGKVF